MAVEFSTGKELFDYVMANGPKAPPFFHRMIDNAEQAGQYGIALADYATAVCEHPDFERLIPVIRDNIELLPWEYPVDDLAEIVGATP